jgi:starvation-inducible DNA-binding protein
MRRTNTTMAAHNTIGLDTSKSAELARGLNDLLANYSILYQNVRGYHWNIKGEKFFELHLKFEEIYSNLVLKIDEIAERILTLGHAPEHRYSAYQSISEIKESIETTEGKKGLQEVVKAFSILLLKERNLLALSSEANDEGTNALMSDYIREKEKMVWMYEAFLK